MPSRSYLQFDGKLRLLF
ncbi:hypothetical protein [Sicyoidochytrium minutum DNA virus]|nr:hypothetical protein [Sicyoidochytrium minutum DNA virus]